VLAGTALVRWDIAQRRDDFQAQARTAHRLLSQRAAELDAILATLALLAPEADAAAHGPPLSFDAARRRFTLRRGQGKHALAIEVDIDRWRPADDWPFAADGPVAARLVNHRRLAYLRSIYSHWPPVGWALDHLGSDRLHMLWRSTALYHFHWGCARTLERYRNR
jgi:hypothetical protein